MYYQVKGSSCFPAKSIPRWMPRRASQPNQPSETLQLVQQIRSNNRLDLCNSDLDSVLYACGVVHENTTPRTWQQNRKWIERFMRINMNLVEALLACAGLSTRFWAYAALLAVDIHDCTVQAHAKCHRILSSMVVPVPSVQLCPFGSHTWVLLPHESVKKAAITEVHNESVLGINSQLARNSTLSLSKAKCTPRATLPLMSACVLHPSGSSACSYWLSASVALSISCAWADYWH